MLVVRVSSALDDSSLGVAGFSSEPTTTATDSWVASVSVGDPGAGPVLIVQARPPPTSAIIASFAQDASNGLGKYTNNRRMPLSKRVPPHGRMLLRHRLPQPTWGSTRGRVSAPKTFIWARTIGPESVSQHPYTSSATEEQTENPTDRLPFWIHHYTSGWNRDARIDNPAFPRV